ncbi:hypothetical protein cym2001_45790 [Pseudomonas sp. CYM-20-01]|nr:hypothetical protein cym2001_45790 [Pseudomonas sp. CYM-20-01]
MNTGLGFTATGAGGGVRLAQALRSAAQTMRIRRAEVDMCRTILVWMRLSLPNAENQNAQAKLARTDYNNIQGF